MSSLARTIPFGFEYSKLRRFAFSIALICVFAVPVSAQVPDIDLNSLERTAAINRESTKQNLASSKPGIDFFTLLIKGGVFMVPIGIVSIVVVTIVFDRMIGLRWGRLIPRKLRRDLVQLNRQGNLNPNEVFQACGESRSALANVVRNVALCAGRPLSDLQSVAQEATQIEADRAYGNVRWLNLAAGIAPLLGLLGTVWGLIRAFHDTTQLAAGQNRADFLSVGIYEALVTTLAGLMVAIPAAVASHYFEGRVTKIFGSISELSSSLFARFEHLEGKSRFELIGRELVARDIRTTSGQSTVGQSTAGQSSPVPPPVSTGTSQAASSRSSLRTDFSRSEARTIESERTEKPLKKKPLS